MLSHFLKHLPDEILYASAYCNDRRMFEHFYESHQWSRKSKLKATKIRRKFHSGENTIEHFHVYPQLLENDNIDNKQTQNYQFSTSLF